MATDRNEMNFDELRNLTTEERVRRFRARTTAISTVDVTISSTKTRWHLVDQDMTPEQIADLPAARPDDTRTHVLWVKFIHRSQGEIVVSRGRFDHDGGTWTARLSSVDDGDTTGTIVALEWSPIVAGKRPWQGPTIKRHVADPW
jgi:hypothetical protein